jgi:poly(3-hydroxybutyrate) depolymerase
VVTHGRDVDGNLTDSYSECDAETALIEVAGADHTWPAASAESIWAFFTDKRLSSP